MAAEYWIGNNGNIYYGSGKAGAKVQDLGSSTNGQYQIGKGGIYDKFTDNGKPALIYSATEINNPSNRVVQGAVSGGASTGGGSDEDPGADRAYLDTQEGQLRQLLKSAQKTKTQGLTQIDDDYNREKGRAGQQKDSAIAGYATNREDTTRDKMGAINTINSNARTLSDSVRRILSMASGRNTTAYKEAAPNAIARDTTEKRTDINDAYGRNFRDIDSAEQGTISKFDEYLEDLGLQRKEKRRGLEEGVLEQEQGIYNNLSEVARQRALLDGGGYDRVRNAMAPISAEISSRQARMDSLFDKFRSPYKTQSITAEAPELADYTTDKTLLNAEQNAGGAAGDSSPFYNFLRKRFQTA